MRFFFSAENIARVIDDAIQEWNLPLKVGTILVTDNASNMKAAGRELKAYLHLGCFAHTLNLAVQKSMKTGAAAPILSRVRRLVAFFHRSHLAASILEREANLMKLNATSLTIDIVTRWNSAFDMLARFLQLQVAVVATIRSKELSGLKEKDIKSLNDDEIAQAEDLQRFLKPLKDMTVLMSSESNLTASLILPLHNRLVGESGHLRPKASDSQMLASMKEEMLKDFQGRYDDVQDKLRLISVLDPRFKNLTFVPETERPKVFFDLTELAANLPSRAVEVKQEPDDAQTDNNALPALPDLPGSSAQDGQACPSSEQKPAGLSLLDSLLGEDTDCVVTHADPAPSNFERATIEITAYKSETQLARIGNPLQWWKDNAFRYPLLSPVAQVLLSVPATSVPSERVFSTAGDICTAQRASLGPDQVDMLVFLKKNME